MLAVDLQLGDVIPYTPQNLNKIIKQLESKYTFIVSQNLKKNFITITGFK